MEYKNDMNKGYEKPEDTEDKGGCYKECNLYTGVSLPIEIEPRAKVGDVEIDCVGDTEVKKECCRDNVHRITITQQFCIKIPVCYLIRTTIGDCETDCHERK